MSSKSQPWGSRASKKHLYMFVFNYFQSYSIFASLGLPFLFPCHPLIL